MPILDPVFVDTSGWLALLLYDDRHHVRADALWLQFARERRVLVTTDWIFAETGNGLARTARRTDFERTVFSFRRSVASKFVLIGDELFAKALDLYTRADDKTWGLVDCASFGVMRNTACREALTADRHFEQAGFTCLLPTN